MNKSQAKQLRSLRPELQRIIVEQYNATGPMDFAKAKVDQQPVDIGLFEVLKTKDQLNLFENDKPNL